MTCRLEYCDREVSIKKFQLCNGHYQQQYKGKPFAPLQEYKMLLKNDEGRVCTDCETFKPWDEFLVNSTGVKRSKCRKCIADRVIAARDKRLARGIPCSEENCDTPADLLGLCSKHYNHNYYERNANASR